ncbi:hypothetical protein B0T24DRAFT_589628 [Lasiosphaeria ovina]|uniref:Uncharacterized protein n=1 Tax=Lasiosphaeria ovina TaxID=92902 RepID=A0AAE0KMT3_9PEZI|nr:hypothetical protein B0T24DRAFT_589628 [Lasiosphaeria ovina]
MGCKGATVPNRRWPWTTNSNNTDGISPTALVVESTPRQTPTFQRQPRAEEVGGYKHEDPPRSMSSPRPQDGIFQATIEDVTSHGRHGEPNKSSSGPTLPATERLETAVASVTLAADFESNNIARQEAELERRAQESKNDLQMLDEMGRPELSGLLARKDHEIASLQNLLAEVQNGRERYMSLLSTTQSTLDQVKRERSHVAAALCKKIEDLKISQESITSLQQSVEQETNRRKQLEEENHELRRDAEDLHGQSQRRLQEQELRAANDVKNFHLAREHHALVYQKDAEIESLRLAHQAMIDQKDAEIKSLGLAHQDELTTQRRKLQAEILKLQLRAMYGIADDGTSVPISDFTFRWKLDLLGQRIREVVTYVPPPELQMLDRSLDRNEFLRRNANYGQAWLWFVQSIFWELVVRGFFQYPLGFGVFGTEGKGFDILSHLFESIANPSAEDPIVLVMPNDKKSNIRRSFFFEGILSDVKNPAQPGRETGFAADFRANVDRVAQDLVRTLQQCSNGKLDARGPPKIEGVVHDLGLLALEMGSQRAHVFIEGCAHGERITAGDRFKIEEGSADGLDMWRVDLMTQPCMVRVGDGTEDPTTTKVISKGKIVPLVDRI